MRYDHKKCEDEEDAARMAEVILRELGYTNVQRGTNIFDATARHSRTSLAKIGTYAGRIQRWAIKAKTS